MSGFFHSTEFYVIASMAAAAVVGLCVRPPSRGEAIERLLAGTLCRSDSNDPEPRVTISCPEDGGPVLLTRSGLAGLTSAGAVSLAVTVTGTDVAIEERITGATSPSEPVDTALFTLDFLRPGRYNVRYNSSSLGLFSAFTLSVRPGASLTRPLRQ